MPQPSLDYLAGFFDGEGCIYMTKRTTGTHRLYISVNCTYRPILEVIMGKFGGLIKLALSGTNKTMYAWELSSIDGCLAFLRQMEPLLIEKQEQAKIAIAWLEYRKCFPLRSVPAGYDKALADGMLQQLRTLKHISS